MKTADHVRACRLRTKDLLIIAEGIYDDKERQALERMIREFEELAITAGPRRRPVSGNGSGGRPAARKAEQASDRSF
jgi:hypothetical protein